MKKRLLAILIGCAVTAVMAAAFLVLSSTLETAEGKALNLWFKIRGPASPSGQVVIVAIDQESIQKLGNWPWPRDRLAGLLKAVCAMGPAQVAWDITFSSPKAENAGTVAAATESLAQASSSCANVQYPFFFIKEERANVSNVLPPPPEIQELGGMSVADAQKLENMPLIQARELVYSASLLTAAGRAGGHVNIRVEEDDACRRDVHLIYFGGSYLPSLSLTVIQKHLGAEPKDVTIYPDSGIAVKNLFVPMDENACGLMNFYGPAGSFPHVSAAAIMGNTADPASLKGKIALIGVTVPGVSEIFKTPYARALPTVEKLATSIENSLENSWISRTTDFGAYELIILAVGGILLSLLFSFARLRISLSAGLIFTLLCLIVSFIAFSQFHSWIRLLCVSCAPWPILAAIFGFKNRGGKNSAK